MLARDLLAGEDAASRRELDEELAALLSRQLSVVVAAERWRQRDWMALLQWLESRLVRAVRAQFAAQISDNPAVARLASVPGVVLFALLDQLHTLINQTLAGTNPNPQLALESLLFSACDALNKKIR